MNAFSHIGIRKINTNPCQKPSTLHHPIGQQCWATAHTSWPWFTSPATCMTHPQLHSVPGLLISQMVPSVVILGFYEKIQQKTDPEQAGFIFLCFFCFFWPLRKGSWHLAEMKQCILAIRNTNYKVTTIEIITSELGNKGQISVWHIRAFFAASPERSLSQLGNIEFLNGDAHCTLKMVAQCILCIFIDLLCILDLSGSSEE